ncbi:hypothetical protein LEP1GSC062_4459 [Leptospira alexanderi serovar Manhao 3 str. L 60]|uniref:Uncharacterized protein n=1 Tax=Leptospira alexanderi serovar Manhao 3 str. L 60 TaxID=1049759 RepID=V6I2H6_9LEPT|nr:hypothetical protein LEP1GSC062_4459 [Leptospira alexanderi serovar Manhao 3 str. L 60]
MFLPTLPLLITNFENQILSYTNIRNSHVVFGLCGSFHNE